MAYIGGANHENGGASPTTTCSVTYSPTAGNTLFVTVGLLASSNSVPTCAVADNGGGANTYVAPAVSRAFDVSDGYSMAMFYLASVSGSPTTITATIGASQQFTTIVVDEYSGLSAFATSNITFAQVAGGANAVAAGNITTAANGELIYGVALDVMGLGGSTVAGTSPVSATLRQSIAGLLYTEDGTQTSSGLLTNGITFSSTSLSNWIAGVMAFTAGGGGGGGGGGSGGGLLLFGGSVGWPPPALPLLGAAAAWKAANAIRRNATLSRRALLGRR